MASTLTFRFDTFGDTRTASSRLRAWKLGEFLAQHGHRVMMNEGETCDVYVCQKVRPFPSLRQCKENGALVVYDFDDHLLLQGVEGQGVKDEVIAFMNAADVVTVGSGHLLRAARRYHPNVFVLDNPVDVSSTTVVRRETSDLKRIGWFGTRAGLTDLRVANTKERVETVTRKGDIEFDLDTVDGTLAEFDLLLLPVTLNEWNLAKNANRMAKAVALGVPVLATATPEHVRVAAELGLDDRFLVHEGEAWDAKIAALRGDFGAAQQAIGQARSNVLELYSLQRIGADWLRQIERARAGEAVEAAVTTSVDSGLTNAALIEFSFRAHGARLAENCDSEFGSYHHVASAESQGDYFELFGRLWDAVQAVEEEWIVLKPDDFHFAPGFAGEVKRVLQESGRRPALVVRGHELGFPPDEWSAYDNDLRETLCWPRDPGVLIVRRDWLLEQPWRPSDCLSYWTWLLVVEAMSSGTLAVVETPVTWRKGAADIVNVSRESASSLKSRHKDALVDPGAQWWRFSVNLLSRLAESLPSEAAAAFAWLASNPPTIAADEKLALAKISRLERQLRAVYASPSWRLSSPMRVAERSISRLRMRLRPPGGGK